jgi:opacity protein-like surface antigen
VLLALSIAATPAAARAHGDARSPAAATGSAGAAVPATAAPDAGAQRTAPPPRTAARPDRPPAFSFRGQVDLGYVSFSAQESLDAVYDGRGGALWGGGVRVAHRAGWFAQVSAWKFATEGERVFVLDQQVFPLGIPTTLTIVPLDVTGGWRFQRRPSRGPATPPRAARPAGRGRGIGLVPYVGGGVGVVRVTERADFAESGDDVEERHTSYHLLGGADIGLSRWVGAGVEAGWRWVPDALEGNGVAQAFGETDLDHFFIVVRVTIGR